MDEINKNIEISQVKQALRKGIRAIIFLSIPFLVSILIWGLWLNPKTYWQKLVSLIGGFITLIVVFYIELELFT